MSDQNTPIPEPAPAPEQPAPEANEAWKSVVAELDALGDAIGRWAKAAVNDPDNKRRLEELSNRLEGFVDNVKGTVKNVAEGDVADSFREAADKTGDALRAAGEKVSEEVGPKLAGAFKSLGDKLRSAAEHIEEKSAPAPAPEPAPEPPADDAAPKA